MRPQSSGWQVRLEVDQYDRSMQDRPREGSEGPRPPFATEALIRETIKQMRPFRRSEIWIDEFWIPGTKERADLAVVGRELEAYEIKTERDDLRRLPRQMKAFSSLFDRCTVVIAEKHVDGCIELIPDWWGVVIAALGPTGVDLDAARTAKPNPEPDPEILVRLLWKQEVEEAVKKIAAPSPPHASRQVLWASLLKHGSPSEIQKLVRAALRCRDGATAKLPSNRFNVARTAADS